MLSPFCFPLYLYHPICSPVHLFSEWWSLCLSFFAYAGLHLAWFQLQPCFDLEYVCVAQVYTIQQILGSVRCFTIHFLASFLNEGYFWLVNHSRAHAQTVAFQCTPLHAEALLTWVQVFSVWYSLLLISSLQTNFDWVPRRRLVKPGDVFGCSSPLLYLTTVGSPVVTVGHSVPCRDSSLQQGLSAHMYCMHVCTAASGLQISLEHSLCHSPYIWRPLNDNIFRNYSASKYYRICNSVPELLLSMFLAWAKAPGWPLV